MEPGTNTDGRTDREEAGDASTLSTSPPRERRRRLRPRRVPWVTLTLLLVIVAIEVTASLAGNVRAHFWLMAHFAHNRIDIWQGELWRLATAPFLHGMFAHLAGNSLALLFLGYHVEKWFGARRFLWIYGLSALGGQLSFQAFAPGGGAGVGASGAIYGLGAVFLIGRVARLRDGRLVLGRRFWVWLAVLCGFLYFESAVVAKVVFDDDVQVADSAHFGGLLAGLIVGCYFFSTRSRPGKAMRRRMVAVGGILAVVVAAYGFAFPAFDWTWYVWRADRTFFSADFDPGRIASLQEQARRFGGDDAALGIIIAEARRGRVLEAYDYWDREPPEDLQLQADAGLLIYQHLYAKYGTDDGLHALLERLCLLGDRLLAQDPESVQHLNSAAWLRALREEDLDVALTHAEKALAGAPGDPSVMNTLGWVRFVRGETFEGLALLQKAVALAQPDPKNEQRNAFWAYLRRVYRSSVSRTSSDEGLHWTAGELYLYLAIAYETTGLYAEARHAASVARRLGSPSPDALRRLADLEARL